VLSVHSTFTRYTSLFARNRSVLGVLSVRLVAEKPDVFHVLKPEPPAARETTFTALALSTAHPLEHWRVGAVPDPPVRLAPVVFSVSEPAGSVKPPVT
jgi:hypothetical protein